MSTEQDAFAKAIGALRPYLTDLVVVGGWAHRLFRLRPRVTLPAFQPLVTDDADVATPLRIAKDRPPINTLLEAAGFKEELAGDENPPVSRYVLATAAEDFELEFIADRHGSRHKRDRSRDVTMAVAGITAQKLRHVEALLTAPWTVHLDEAVGYNVPDGSAEVRIPNAASYLFQKLAVLPSRELAKRGKDVLYMFDTLRLFASALDDVRECWHVLAPSLPHKVRTEFAALWARQFTANADFVVAAASIARDTGRPSPPTAATVAATCRAGFDAVFGPGQPAA